MKPLINPPFTAVHQNAAQHRNAQPPRNSQLPKTGAAPQFLRAPNVAQPKLATGSRHVATSPNSTNRPARPQTAAHGCNHQSCAHGNTRQRGAGEAIPTASTRHATLQPVVAGRKASAASPVNPTRRTASAPVAPSAQRGGRTQPPSTSATPKVSAMPQTPRAATPQRFENRALTSGTQNGRNAATAPAPAKKLDYMVHAPAHVGAGRQQIRVTIKGTHQVAGSVDIRPTQGGKVHISNLKVERSFRKRGIANQLMDAVINTARTQGYSGARLEARPSDDGISPQALVSMYQKMGFKNVGKSSRGNPLMERHL